MCVIARVRLISNMYVGPVNISCTGAPAEVAKLLGSVQS